MQRIILIFFFFLCTTITYFFIKNIFFTSSDDLPSPYKKTISPTAVKIVQPENFLDVTRQNGKFRIAWYKTQNNHEITLEDNFTYKDSTSSLFKFHNCKFLINGGFYTQDDKPLGLFINHGKLLSEEIPSSLINGYVLINNNNNVSITQNYNSDGRQNYKHALQTGPMLISDTNKLNLRIKNDENARRSGIFISDSENTYFFIIYDRESVFSGPKLADVPDILINLQNRTDIIISSAINLDGGSASAFHEVNFSLSEIVYTGSFFCIK